MLISYFSATGTTRSTAQKLAGLSGGRLYEIQPVRPYSPADLDWTNPHSRSSREMEDPAARPEIAGSLPTLKDGEAVCIGFPNWWAAAPRIIETFLDRTDLTGHPVYLFETSGGTGIEKAERSLRAKYPELNIVHSARLQPGNLEKIEQFAERLSE